MVEAPSFREIAGDVLFRLSNMVVVGHNVDFDLAFLRAEFARCGWPFTVASYTVQVQPETVPPSSATCQLKAPASGQDRQTFYELTGDLTCSGTAEATFVRVAALFLDRSGQPVGASADFFMQVRIAPGSAAPFRIIFSDPGVPPSSVAAFRVFIDWR